MRNKRKNMILVLLILPLCLCAQVEEAEKGLSQASNFLGMNSLYNAALYIGGAFIAVGLVWVIWAVTRKKPYAMESVLSWLLAIAVYLLLAMIF